MPRAYTSRLAVAALLAAMSLSCNDDSNPSSPSSANLAQMATKRGPTLPRRRAARPPA
jgi:hypothetical protein